MRSWRRSGLILPAWYREQEDLGRVGSDGTLWPACRVCSKKYGYNIAVTAYGIKDEGKLPGKNSPEYTDVFARCHGEEDIIRIEGIRWSKTCPKDGSAAEQLSDINVFRMAALKAMPFFHPGSEAGRVIPAAVTRELFSATIAAGNR